MYFHKNDYFFKPNICKTFCHSLVLTRDRTNIRPPDIWISGRGTRLHTKYPVDRIPDIQQNIRPYCGHPVRLNFKFDI